MPVLLRQPSGDVLLVSCVDRRSGRANCSVFAWAGGVTETGFAVAAGWPAGGQRVDLGPDFYAAIPAASAPTGIEG
ncbi:MAG: hypothetical protein H7267_03055 [Sandarakinorhabdus sp.]|nr:hypothetical protein [Sandarakinorhabdus sp.]